MIQRIQTVFLALAIVLNIIVLFVPMWAIKNAEGREIAVLMGTQITYEDVGEEKSISFTENTLLMVHGIMVIVACGFLAVVIFMYKDRKKQMRMAYFGMGLIAIQIIISIFLDRKLGALVSMPSTDHGQVMFGFFLPVGAILFTWMALKMIKKDDDMVKSVDRMR